VECPKRRCPKRNKTPTPRVRTVARAEPATPIAGNGPYPIISMGSRMILRMLAIIRAYKGVLASPDPRKAWFIPTKKKIKIDKEKFILRYSAA
jgi:hypothetical protein